jgi:hypothetical protein
MDLSFKDIKFMIEAVDNLMVKYQERINQIEDSNEDKDVDEVSDLGNDIMFLSSLRKKIDDSLNDSLSPQPNTSIFKLLSISIFRSLSIGTRKYSKEEITKPKLKHLEATIKALTNHPNGHIKSEFDEDK